MSTTDATDQIRPGQLICPVINCAWRPPPAPALPAEGALADVFGWGVMRQTALAQGLGDQERAWREHLQTHDVLEWVQTVMAARGTIAGLISQLGELQAMMRTPA